jgi:hypothetical protein
MLLGTDLQVGQNTAYAQELRKWEANYTQYGPPGRPHVHRDYPARMYQASRPPQGGPAVFEGVTAEDERDRERLERIGFVYGGQGKALEALEAREFELAELAANRALTDRKMTAKAQAEAEKVDVATIKHLGAIPEAHPKTGEREKPR